MSQGHTRRDFLRDSTAAAVTLPLLSALGASVATSRHAYGSCDGEPSNARPWTPDPRPVIPRRSLGALSEAESARLLRAYLALKNLDQSDPRSIPAMGQYHCAHCGGGTATLVHGNWRFLVWHRAAVYFHERILGKLIDEPDFRLPYWMWDRQEAAGIPKQYADPAEAQNPLYRSNRTLDATSFADVAEHLTAAATATSFEEMGGDGDPGKIEPPHNDIHRYVGGDMATWASPRDPIFFAHHSNVDRMWVEWRSVDPGARAASLPEEPFYFVDENAEWRSVKATHFVDEAPLGYSYEDLDPSRWPRPRISSRYSLPLDKRNLPILEGQLKLPGRRVLLEIRGMAFPARPTATAYDLFWAHDAAVVRFGSIVVLGSRSPTLQSSAHVLDASALRSLRGLRPPRFFAQQRGGANGQRKPLRYKGATIAIVGP